MIANPCPPLIDLVHHKKEQYSFTFLSLSLSFSHSLFLSLAGGLPGINILGHQVVLAAGLPTLTLLRGLIPGSVQWREISPVHPCGRLEDYMDLPAFTGLGLKSSAPVSAHPLITPLASPGHFFAIKQLFFPPLTHPVSLSLLSVYLFFSLSNAF